MKRFAPLLILLLLLAGYVFLQKENFSFSTRTTPSEGSRDVLAEARKFEGKNYSYNELEEFFQKLAREKGAAYAFDVLKVAKLPPDTDLHLLGHAVGDMLYEQKGLEGITVCTDDFRNACSHSIVVGLFLNKGEGALPEIARACEKAPGGSGAYTMCFHGLGHGILSAVSFDVPKAVEICQKIGSVVKRGGEEPQCIGGIVMEIVGGGGHDKITWGKQREKFLQKTNPLSLCRGTLIPEDSKFFCYVYITPFLWEAKGTNPGNPASSDFQKTFPICNEIPVHEPQNRDACYGGFGKEFVGLAASRDIRRVDQMDENQMKTVYEWCRLAASQEGTGACITHALSALYWGGENDRAASIKFCNVMANNDYFQRTCFMNLITAVSSYVQDVNYRKGFCSELPQEYNGECRVRLEI